MAVPSAQRARVRLLRRVTARRRAEARRVEALADVARMLVETEDPREGLARAALRLARAQRVLLFEGTSPAPGLVLRVTAGEPGTPPVIDAEQETSLTALAYRSGERSFVADARLRPGAPERLVEADHAVAVLAQPVRRAERVVGVLTLLWDHRVDLDHDTAALLGVLAASAGVAIERSRLLARAQEAARTDPLTGLANRRVWDRALPRELARAGRRDSPLSIALLDLDHFKALNDRQGHVAGDDLLRVAAQRWSTELRTTDLLVRYGGEEFAVLLPDTPLEAAVEVVNRLRLATPGGQTCSAGVARWDGAEGSESLVARADRALYHAKATGRDRTGVDDPAARRRLLRRL